VDGIFCVDDLEVARADMVDVRAQHLYRLDGPFEVFVAEDDENGSFDILMGTAVTTLSMRASPRARTRRRTPRRGSALAAADRPIRDQLLPRA